MKTKRHWLTLTLNDELYQEFKSYAEQEHRTVTNSLIHLAIRALEEINGRKVKSIPDLKTVKKDNK